MVTSDEQISAGDVQATQPRAFTATELVACPACSRSNPPARANCLYCGANLGSAPNARALTPAAQVSETEPENLVHLVALSGSERLGSSDQIAQLLNRTRAEVDVLLGGNIAPLYSASSATEAEAISDKLQSLGITPLSVSDDDLQLKTPARPIAALSVDDETLTASVRRTGERISIGWDDLALGVVGRLYLTITEVEQKPGKSKQLLDERQMVADESVLDLYAGDDMTGWRLRAGSFDFSCLGAQKQVTAFENFRSLVELLQRKAAHAQFDDAYLRLRSSLNTVWPPEPAARTTERRRTFRREINASATTTDNELQFTRYSRLRRFIDAPGSQTDVRS